MRVNVVVSSLCVFRALVVSDRHFVLLTGTAAVHAVIKAGDRYAWPGDENAEEAEEEEERDEENDEA